MDDFTFNLLSLPVLVVLLIVALSILFISDFLVCAVLTSIFSMVIAVLYMALGAPDVALTEASVGAGLSAVFALISFSSLTVRESVVYKKHPVSIILPLCMMGWLLYAIPDMPKFGDYNAPINQHTTPYYLENSMPKFGVRNFVTTILAGFRGYDTFGETVVVFTATMGVSMIMRKKKIKIVDNTTDGVKYANE